MLQRLTQKFILSTLAGEEYFFSTPERLAAYRQARSLALAEMAPLHEEYIHTISSPSMAASLELAASLYGLCAVKQPKRLLDLGSGFSSYAFRKWAAENPGTTVVSVDDDAAWLEKTRDYLRERGVSTDGVITFDEFLRSDERNFDIILHDMNFVEVRRNYIDEVIQRAAPGGWMLFDDVHKTGYFHDVMRKLRTHRLRGHDFRPSTFDSFQRYTLIAVR